MNKSNQLERRRLARPLVTAAELLISAIVVSIVVGVGAIRYFDGGAAAVPQQTGLMPQSARVALVSSVLLLGSMPAIAVSTALATARGTATWRDRVIAGASGPLVTGFVGFFPVSVLIRSWSLGGVTTGVLVGLGSLTFIAALSFDWWARSRREH